MEVIPINITPSKRMKSHSLSKRIKSNSSSKRIKSHSLSKRVKSDSSSNAFTRKKLLSSLSNSAEFDETIIFSENEIIPQGSVSLFCNTHGNLSFNIEENKKDIKYEHKYVNPHFFDPYLKLHRFIKTSKGAASFSNINEDNNIYKRLMYKNNIFSTKLFTNLKYSDFEKRIKPYDFNEAEHILNKAFNTLYKPMNFNNTLSINNDILINKVALSKTIYKKIKQKYNEKYYVNRVLNKIFYIDERLFITDKSQLKEAIETYINSINSVIVFRNDVNIIYPFYIKNENITNDNINEFIVEKLKTFSIFEKINVDDFLNNIYYKIGIPIFLEENEKGKKYKILYKKGTNLLSCPYFISYLLEAVYYDINDIYPNIIFSNSFDSIPSGSQLEYYTYLCREYPQLIVEVGGIPLTKEDYYSYFKNKIILSVSKTIRTLMVEKINLQSLLVYLQGNDEKNVYMVDYSCDFISINKEKLLLYRKVEKKINQLKEKIQLTNRDKDQIRKYENMIRILEDQTIRGGN
jgi:hypothetical protein